MAEVEENWQDFYSASARVMTRSLIRELLKLTRRGNIISFAGGLPDPATFPVEEIKAITAGLLEREANLVLQYGPTEGDARLRDELVKWMAKDGNHVSRDQVLVTLGSQQGLDLVGRVFLDPGDLVIVELPSYMAALQVFRSYRAEMRGVPQDDAGMRADVLEETLARLARDGRRPKLIYVVPDFQNPSGVTMSNDRRLRLLQLARQYRTLVVEDNPYREWSFEGAPRRDLDPSPRRPVSLGAAAGRHGHGTIVAAGSRRRRRLCGGGGVSRRRRRAQRHAAELLISLGAGDRGRRPTPGAARTEKPSVASSCKIAGTRDSGNTGTRDCRAAGG